MATHTVERDQGMTHPVCWLCREVGDSAEHRLKRSDIVRAYGLGPYRGDSAPVHVRAGKSTAIQGSKAKILKYQPSLCHSCNTTRTQPSDRAYERFTDWILLHEASVLRRRFLNFAEVYGAGWPQQQLDLYRYFAKSFACRLVEAGQPVPVDVIDLFVKTEFQTGLRLSFAVNEDVLLLPAEAQGGFIGKGDLISLVERTDPSVVNGYMWDEHVSWLTTFYGYCASLDGDLGSKWIANSQHVYLGSHTPLNAGVASEDGPSDGV